MPFSRSRNRRPVQCRPSRPEPAASERARPARAIAGVLVAGLSLCGLLTIGAGSSASAAGRVATDRATAAHRRTGVRLLAGRLRRRGVLLRRRRVLRLDRRHPPQQAGGRHGRDRRQPGLLAGRLRRRGLRLRRRRPSTARRAASRSTSPSSAWPPPRRPRATGWSPPTAGSSPSATPASTARWAATHLNQPVVGHGRHPGRQGLLAGRLRRRDLRLRRRRLLRVDRRTSP